MQLHSLMSVRAPVNGKPENQNTLDEKLKWLPLTEEDANIYVIIHVRMRHQLRLNAIDDDYMTEVYMR